MKKHSVTVLFPGKFKPFTDGHHSIIKRYLESPYTKDIKIIVSGKDKDGIRAEDTVKFLESLYHGEDNYVPEISIMISPTSSPIGYCYDIIKTESTEGDVYCLASSSKGGDDARTKSFVKAFSKEGKHHMPGVDVIDFPIESDPLVYEYRSDEYKGYPVSATYARMDLEDKDFDSFLTNYALMISEGIADESLIKEYYDNLLNVTAVTVMQVTEAESFRINPIIIEKKTPEINIKPIIISESHSHDSNNIKPIIISQPDISSPVIKPIIVGDLLLEGGAAGHMLAPFDVMEFTFADYRNIINQVMENKLKMTEKVDGVNCHLTWVPGEDDAVFARNKTHLRGSYLKLEDLKDGFSTPEIGELFYRGCVIINDAIQRLSDEDKSTLFNDGKRWLNFEIIDSALSNIIPYSTSEITVHDFRTFDEKYNIDTVSDEGLETLLPAFNAVNRTHPEFLLTLPHNIVITKSEAKILQDSLLSDLRDIQTHFKSTPKHRVGDAIIKMMRKIIIERHEDIAPYFKMGVDIGNDLLLRWIYKDKTYNITQILKPVVNADDKAALREFDKTGWEPLFREILVPIQRLFVKLGNTIFHIADGFVNSNNEGVSYIENRVKSSRDYVYNNKLTKFYDVFDNIKQINATEGVVFTYNDYLLKLTGSFFWINKVFHLKSRDTGGPLFTQK